MAFDKPTRNKLARMVGECRRLLTDDIRDQLQAVYGIQPDSDALEVDKLAHLDDRGREVAIAAARVAGPPGGGGNGQRQGAAGESLRADGL